MTSDLLTTSTSKSFFGCKSSYFENKEMLTEQLTLYLMKINFIIVKYSSDFPSVENIHNT